MSVSNDRDDLPNVIRKEAEARHFMLRKNIKGLSTTHDDRAKGSDLESALRRRMFSSA